MAGRNQSVSFEELIVVIDTAGRLQGDNMRGIANPQTTTPGWAHGIEQVIVCFTSPLDALGQVAGMAVLEGSAFPDGPHEIVLGAVAGEDVNIHAGGVKATAFVDMGIRVVPGANYTVTFMIGGDTIGEAACSIELLFQEEEVRQPKRWVWSEETIAAVDTNVQGTNSTQVAEAPGCGGSETIGGVIGASAGDLAALGNMHGVMILTEGVLDRQEILLGGVGGELITGEGVTNPPTQRAFIDYPTKPEGSVYIEFRGVIEAGQCVCAASIGFVVPGV